MLASLEHAAKRAGGRSYRNLPSALVKRCPLLAIPSPPLLLLLLVLLHLRKRAVKRQVGWGLLADRNTPYPGPPL